MQLQRVRDVGSSAAVTGLAQQHSNWEAGVNEDTSSIWPLMMGIGACAAVLGWNIAKRKGLDRRKWAVICFFFFPAVIGLAFLKSQRRPGETEAFQSRWTSLAAYDPDIKAAIARLSALGTSAVEQFRMAYADVQTKEAIPLIVTDIEQRWAAGERFTREADRLKTLAELHATGRVSDREYEAQKRRLLDPPKAKGFWSGWWWKAPVLLLLILMLWPRSPSAGFPTCQARPSRDLVRQALEESEDAPTKRTKLLALDEVRELSHDPKTPQRYCAALAALNSGEQRITWRLYQRGDNLFVEVSSF